jgi:hypothetical protein
VVNECVRVLACTQVLTQRRSLLRRHALQRT